MTFLKDRMALLVLVLSSVAVAVLLADLLTGRVLAELVAGEQTDEGSGGQGEVELVYAFDVSDKRELVGAATNVFVGRVIGKTGEEGTGGSDPEGPAEPLPELPRTQFEVAVTENIKGSIKGRVTVSQEGGYAEYAANKDYPEAGVRKGERVRELQLFEGDPLLRPGREVLLVTNRDEQNDWYQIVAPKYGDVRLETDVQGDRQRTDQGERRRVIAEFEEAARDQIRDPILDREPVPPEERPPPPEGLTERPAAPPESPAGQ